MSIKVTFTYKVEAGISEVNDRRIKKYAKKNNLKWYAQGYNFTTGVRDLCFDINE